MVNVLERIQVTIDNFSREAKLLKNKYGSYTDKVNSPDQAYTSYAKLMKNFMSDFSKYLIEIEEMSIIEFLPFKESDLVEFNYDGGIIQGKIFKKGISTYVIYCRDHVKRNISYGDLRPTENWGRPHMYQQFTDICLLCDKNDYKMNQFEIFLPCEGRKPKEDNKDVFKGDGI